MPTASDYDSAWKDALEHYFPAFMGLLWPLLHARIDWAQAPVFRDKELQALLRSARRGRRHVDKLVSMRLLSGQDSLLMIHVEVQAGRVADLAHRMYTYYTRLYETHPEQPMPRGPTGSACCARPRWCAACTSGAINAIM